MNNQSLHKQLAILAVGLMAADYGWAVMRYTLNFPYWDDYYALLDFVAVQISHAPPAEKLAAAFEQHYEHRVVTGRLLTWAWYEVFGEVNFRGLVAIANLFYLGFVALLLWRGSNKWGLKAPHLLLIGGFAFILNQWETSSWATTGLFFYAIDFFALLAILAWFGHRRFALPLTVAAGAAAGFSGAHGMLVLPAILATALLQVQGSRKRWWGLLLGFGLLAACYAWGYERPAHQPPILATLLRQPTMAMRYFLVITGNVFNAGKNMALGWGIFCSLLLAWVMYKQAWRRYPELFALLLFFLLAVLVTTAGRSAVGAGQAFTLRYVAYSAPYSALLLVLAALLAPTRWQAPVATVFAAIALLGFAASWIKMLPQVKRKQEDFYLQRQRLQEGKLSAFDYGAHFDNKKMAKDWLRRYDSLGIFPFRFPDDQAVLHAIPPALGPAWKLEEGWAEQDSFYAYYRFRFSGPDSIRFAALELIDEAGTPGWFALMRRTGGGPGQQLFEVSLFREMWPGLPQTLRLQLTDEAKRDTLTWHLKPADYQRRPWP